MFPTIIELRPDRSLIQEDFDGYKLSLDATPILKHELGGIGPAKIRTNKFSFLHAALFGLQNHLISDKFESNSAAYFIDTSCMVRKVQYDEQLGKMRPILPVFKTKVQRERCGSDYNFSFVFISEFMAVLGDGIGNLSVIDTGDRTKNSEWKCTATLSPLEDQKGFIVQDARFEIENGERQIHCVLLEIAEMENESHICRLHWLVLAKKENSWNEVSRRVLEGKKIPDYCHLETKSKGIVIASDGYFKFVGEAEDTVVQPPTHQPEVHVDLQLLIKWSQTDDDLTVDFAEIVDCVKEDFTVLSTNESLTITHCGQLRFEEKLFAKIDPSLTTWTLQNSQLQVILLKAEVGVWPELYAGGPTEGLETVPVIEEPASTLESELEECDFGVGIEADYNIERFDNETRKVTHRIPLGRVGPLFALNLRPNDPPAIVLRFEHDACVFLQTNSNNLQDSSKWNLRHVGTLAAFGYIQASKQQKKFMTCNVNLDYGIISESERHVFVYKRNDNWSEGLKNRKGRQVKIGQQKLVELEEAGEVLGIVAGNSVTLLLTEKYVICLQLLVKD